MASVYLPTYLLCITAFCTAITPIVVALIGRNQLIALKSMELSSIAAAAKVAEVKNDLAASSEKLEGKVEQIQHSVNSERAEMVAKIEAMHKEILRLSTLTKE